MQLPTSGAFAQEATQINDEVSGGLAEIVVTARRQEERQQSVPIAITAFSQDDLEARRVFALRDITAFTPSLSINQNSSDAFAPYSANLILRGLPGAVTYFSQVPTGSAGTSGGSGMTAVPGHYLDLDHVEIVKGPQGTLFGTNAIGGAILLEPKRPTDEFEGFAQVGIGNYDSREFNGAINVPVIDDRLLVRVAGQIGKRDGYTKLLNSSARLDDRDYQAWRIGVTFRPTDSLENYLVYDGYHQRQNGSSALLNAVDPTSFINLFYPELGAALAQQQALGVRTQLGRTPPAFSKARVWGITDILTWTLADDITLKNVAAVRVSKVAAPVDFDGTLFPILDEGPASRSVWYTNTRQYTNELQLQGESFDGRLDWTIGGFLLHREPAGPVLSQITTLGSTAFTESRDVARSRAVYAQGVYELVEDLRLTAGLRYNWDTITDHRRAYDQQGRCTSSIFADANCVQRVKAKFKAPGWTLGLDYQVSPDVLVYVRSGHAYLAGFTELSAPAPQFARVRPQKVTDIEVGIKSDWTLGDMEGRLNADVFRTWFDDIAVTDLVQFTDATGQLVVTEATSNAAAASVKGVEAEATLIPFEGLTLRGHVSYVETGYTDYPEQAFARAAPEILFVPPWQYGITGSYRLPMDDAIGSVSLTASYTWTDRQFVSANPTHNTLPSWDKLDLRLAWDNVMGNPIDLAFYMTNVTDNSYLMGRYPLMAQLGLDAVVYAEPRMYGVQLKYRFGAGL